MKRRADTRYPLPPVDLSPTFNYWLPMSSISAEALRTQLAHMKGLDERLKGLTDRHEYARYSSYMRELFTDCPEACIQQLIPNTLSRTSLTQAKSS